MIVRAPGKAFVSGEYAVLHGAPAVVVAVARYAVARLAPGSVDELSPFLAAVVARCPAPPGTIPVVDTSALAAHDGTKLGLGSSAAATVAAAGVIRAAAGVRLDDPAAREQLVALCVDAHRAAQGGRGSGADCAAAVHGGAVRFQRGAGGAVTVAPAALPAHLRLLFFHLGRPAWTAEILQQVEALAAADRARHDALMARLGDAAARFEAEPLASMRLQARVLEELGAAAGVAIVSPACRALADTAEALGGAAKPSGAGGGDLAVALVPPEAADALRAASPLRSLALDLDPSGVMLAP